jgi:hypothetical protein
LDQGAHDRLIAIADVLAQGLEAAFADAGVSAVVPRAGPPVGLLRRRVDLRW